MRQDFYVRVDFNDWRDVPFDDEKRRAEIADKIHRAMAFAAQEAADECDVVVATEYVSHFDL